MRNRFKDYGLEGGNFTVDNPSIQETPVTPEASVQTDNTDGATDASKTDEQVIENASDNSSTVVIDTQEQNPTPDLVPKKQLVFLGGTCNESTWRDKLIDGLKMSYFNPVVQNWTEDDKEKENQIKDSADFNLFVFTPKHSGYFSFVEAALLAVKSASRTILCVLQDDDGSTFDDATKRSVDAIIEELSKENIKVFDNLDDVRSFLNGKEEGLTSEETVVAGKGGIPIEMIRSAAAEPIAEETPEVTNTDSAELETNDANVSVKVETPGNEDTSNE